MGAIDIVIATYRGVDPEAYSSLVAMMQESNCACRNPQGAPAHMPWKCPNGKHSIRLMPPLFGSSVVHWARNQAICQALYGQPEDGRPPAEYFLLMDDDMVAEPGYLLRLASYKLDIVCGICTIRRDPPRPNIRFWRPEEHSFHDPIEWDWDSQKLMEIDAAGAAFMMVKRAVFERMATAYLNCEFEKKRALRRGESVDYWDEKQRLRQEKFNRAIQEKIWGQRDCWWFQFLDDAFDSQVGELGEDISFCWKAKQLGYKIYADPQILPGHLGKYAYSTRDFREFVEAAKKDGALPELTENRVALCQ